MLKVSAVATVWRHRDLLRALVARDLQNRYAGSIAGGLWAFANPMIMLGVYSVVFQYVFRVSVAELPPNQPYVLFVAVVLWPWLAFQEAVTRGTLAVQNHASLVKKVAFPHELVVYSAVLSSFVVHYCGFALVLGTLRLMGFAVNFWALPVVAIGALILLVFASAIALVLGALQVFVRDVEQLLAQAMGILFYATPILYAMSSVPDWLASIMQWNPLVHMLEPIRIALLRTSDTNWGYLMLAFVSTVVVFYVARRFFLKLSPYFEDMV